MSYLLINPTALVLESTNDRRIDGFPVPFFFFFFSSAGAKCNPRGSAGVVVERCVERCEERRGRTEKQRRRRRNF